MRYLPCSPHFVAESRDGFGILRQALRQELERHLLVELQVVGAVDFAHPAFAQQRHDAVAACQQRSRRETALIHAAR